MTSAVFFRRGHSGHLAGTEITQRGSARKARFGPRSAGCLHSSTWLTLLLSLGLVTPIGASAQDCALFPIALSVESVAGATVGTSLSDILNGAQPGNFGWLTWAGSPSVPTLVASLTPPGDSATYVNSDNTADHQVSAGDWVQGKPGVSNSQNVRDALEALKAVDSHGLAYSYLWDSCYAQCLDVPVGGP